MPHEPHTQLPKLHAVDWKLPTTREGQSYGTTEYAVHGLFVYRRIRTGNSYTYDRDEIRDAVRFTYWYEIQHWTPVDVHGFPIGR